jgi:predicted DNA-binding transcriptional regulator YafY
VVFSELEALALVMAVLDGRHSAADTDDLVGSALGKVIQALPESIGRQAAALREYALAAPDRFSNRPDPAMISALVAAVAAHRSVVVGYRSESGREWTVEVDPWAVVVRVGRWYLLCHSHQAKAIRTYRIDRIQSMEETTRAFTPPEGLDPVAMLEQNLGSGWEFPTRVVFDAPLDKVAPWIRPAMGRLEPLGDGCVLLGSTSNPPMYAQEWLPTMPFAFRVEGGPELRAAVAAVAQRLHAAVPG